MVTQLPPPPENNDPPRRTRLESEVLEILEQSDRPISFSEKVRARAERERMERRTEMLNRVRHFWTELTPGMMLIGAIFAAFLTWWVQDLSGILARLFAVTSVGLILAPIIMRFRQPSQPTTPRWRGRDMNSSISQPDWYNEMRDRFKRPPRK